MRKEVYALGEDPWATEVSINGNIVRFPKETRNYVIYDNKVIIAVSWNFLKENYPKENAGCNIWCYKDDGSLLWKIEESPDYLGWLEKQTEEEKRKRLEDGRKDYYTEVIYYKGVIKRTRKNKKLGFWQSKWEDYEETGEWLWVRAATGKYDLDPETGKVSNFEYDGGR